MTSHDPVSLIRNLNNHCKSACEQHMVFFNHRTALHVWLQGCICTVPSSWFWAEASSLSLQAIREAMKRACLCPDARPGRVLMLKQSKPSLKRMNLCLERKSKVCMHQKCLPSGRSVSRSKSGSYLSSSSSSSSSELPLPFSHFTFSTFTSLLFSLLISKERQKGEEKDVVGEFLSMVMSPRFYKRNVY